MSMTREAFDALVASEPDTLFALVRQQAAQLAALTARVEQLEARLAGHSQNSHRPPSSDGARKPARSQRARSGRAPGGQPGHPGYTLALTATPDGVVRTTRRSARTAGRRWPGYRRRRWRADKWSICRRWRWS